MSRIALLDNERELAVEQLGEFEAIAGVLHGVRGPFAILLRSPGLGLKVLEVATHIRLASTLEPRERELIILAVAREKDGLYEWSTHLDLARKRGVAENTIEAIRDYGELDSFPEGDREIVEFVRQLLRTNRIEQQLFDTLLRRKGQRWLVESSATVGQYQFIAAINNVFEIWSKDDEELLPV